MMSSLHIYPSDPPRSCPSSSPFPIHSLHHLKIIRLRITTLSSRGNPKTTHPPVTASQAHTTHNDDLHPQPHPSLLRLQQPRGIHPPPHRPRNSSRLRHPTYATPIPRPALRPLTTQPNPNSRDSTRHPAPVHVLEAAPAATSPMDLWPRLDCPLRHDGLFSLPRRPPRDVPP